FEKPLHSHAEAFSFLGYYYITIPNLFLNQPIQPGGYTGYKSYVGYKVIMATEVISLGYS
ncbi:hypothetical protein NK212_14875, partial [Elizabethkingia sp. S0634]|uniref:hypothetical protein n=1 Tax=Elizabethkingia sp. S0634 TaxID=2957806 RepID=UPI0020A158F7